MIKDIRYGFRQLVKSPGFTAMAVLSLALGIGANAAIFSLLDALLLKSLPVHKPAQLYFVQYGKSSFKPSSNVSFAGLEAIRQRGPGLVDATFFGYTIRVNTSINGTSEVVEGQSVSGSFFNTLGVRAGVGRLATDADDVAGAPNVVVLSNGFWQRRFGSNPGVIGQTILLNDRSFTIIGITEPEFFGVIVGNAPDIFIPSLSAEQITAQRSRIRGGSLPMVMVRLNEAANKEQAERELTAVLRETAIAGKTDEERRQIESRSVQLQSASQGLNRLRQEFSKPLELLMAAVGLVLLIACANVANLLLARATVRRREIALRIALGASRFRIIRQLLTEGLILAVLGGGLGLLLASWSSSVLLAVVSSGPNPVTAGANLSINVPIDSRILLFTLVVSVLAALLFGLAPAWQATRLNLSTTLKDTIPLGGLRRFSFGNLLVVGQLAISLTLLIGAGLFVRSLVNLRSVDTGFNRENVLLFAVDPQLMHYERPQIATLYKQILERVAVVPGVKSVTLGRQGLLSGGGTQGSISVPGSDRKSDDDDIPYLAQVGSRFFETLGMSIVQGRDFTGHDNETTPKVAVVNQAFARYYFGEKNPVGQYLDRGEEDGGLHQIVGVVRDAKAQNLREQTARTYYIPFLQDQSSWRETTFQVRTNSDPLALAGTIRQEIQNIDARVPVFRMRTLTDQVEESLGQERLITTLATLFAVLALVLASLGLYGVLSYSVSRQTREIGIRLALGARQINVLRLVVARGMSLALVGVVIGLSASFALTRLMRSLLFEVSPSDPLTFLGVSICLLLIAFVACYVPARRATNVDPLVALRNE
jgi:predicted permease